MPIDPPPVGPEPRGTIEAYTLAPERMDIAATILHNGFLLLALGLFAAGLAVRGRGQVLAVVGGLLGGLGWAKLSGVVFVDWTGSAAGRVVGVDAAVRIDEAIALPWLVAGWFVPQFAFALAGPALLLVGFAIARLLSWWMAVAVPVVAVVLFLVNVPGPAGGALFFGAFLLAGIALAAGLRRRSRGQVL
ncbi:MAG: hypothetical protein ACT4RN_13535 [Pseudonocardia sp.]